MTAPITIDWRYFNELIGEILFCGVAKEDLNGWLYVKKSEHEYLISSPGRNGMSLAWEFWTDNDTDGVEFVLASCGDAGVEWTGNIETDVAIFRDSLTSLMSAA